MPFVTTDDGIRLSYVEAGDGPALVFAHEFGGDARSWAGEIEAFSGSYRSIAYHARGYPPSDVPPELASYGQARARDDLLSVLDGLGIEAAHLVGLSMGSFAVLHTVLAYPDRVRSATLAGIGYGAHPVTGAPFRAEAVANAELIRTAGMNRFVETYGRGPTRIQLERKDPDAFRAQLQMLAEHSAVGSANTLAACQARRPSLYAMTDALAAIDVPTLILLGDEDEPAIEASELLARVIPRASLVVVPRTGHVINLEEPAIFQESIREFVEAVETRPQTATVARRRD